MSSVLERHGIIPSLCSLRELLLGFPSYNSVSFLHTVTLPPVPVEVEGSKRSALQVYCESGFIRETPAMSLLQMSDLALLWFSRMCFVGVHPVSVAAEGPCVC